MGVITYTAVNRGFLVGGHTAGTPYRIETSFEAFPWQLTRKGSVDEVLDGTPEGWVHATQQEWPIRSDRVLLADRANWREFLSSVIGAEVFQIDFTGTIASPGTDVDVYMTSAQVSEEQLGGVAVKYSFRVKAVP